LARELQYLKMTNMRKQLAGLLNKAAQEMLGYGDRPYLGKYDTCGKLGKFIQTVKEEIIAGNESSAVELWGIFAPTCDWDDAGGSLPLGDEVFALLSTLYRPT